MANTRALGNSMANAENESSQVGGNSNLRNSVTWLMARVSENGAITSDNSKYYNGVSSLGGIRFESLGIDINDVSEGIAQSLFPHVIVPPLEGEIVLILQNKSNSGGFEFYYISSLNLYNNGSYNPDVPLFRLDENDNIPLGEGLSESNLDTLRKLFLSPGDISLEGRFGNTIHLGNSNVNTPYKGKQNSPITIIRNGQKEVDSLDPIFEDINNDNSSIYLTKGQTVPINVISTNMQTFNGEEKKITDSNNTLSLLGALSDGTESGVKGFINDIDPIVNDKEAFRTSTTEFIEGFSKDAEEEIVERKDPPSALGEESDQVFTPINSEKYKSIQPTSDPITTDPPPTPPPTIPEDADVYFLQNGNYVYFEKGRHKLGAIVMDGGSTVYIGIPSFEKTKKRLAEEAAEEVGSPIYGIEDPNPNSEPSSDPGNSNSPDDPVRLDDFIYYYDDGAYIQKEVIYKIYKDNVEYYGIGPDFPNDSYDYYSGGSVSSNDDNSGIASVINSIEDYWAL